MKINYLSIPFILPFIMTGREQLILNYTEGYNALDIDRMVRDFNEDIIFQNIANGEVTLSLTGLQAFKAQAEQAKQYFVERTQTIQSITHRDTETEVAISYHAVVATDLPNGWKKGDVLSMQGRSVFKFRGNKIVQLTDIS